MNGRRVWFFPLGVLGLLIGASLGWTQEKTVQAEPKAAKEIKALSPQELADVIDKHINDKLTKNKIKPAAQAAPAELMRRLYLDVAGRVPKVADARAYLEDKSADKHAKLVEKLLDSPQYVDHLSSTLRALMISQQATPQASFLGRNFQMWLVEKIRADLPYDRLVHEILTVGTQPAKQPGLPGGGYVGPFGAGGTAFFQANENKPENLAGATARIFMGVRLECAQCHDHPFSDWKKDQFWEFAAFFVSPNANPNFPAGVQPIGGVQQPLPANFKPMIAIPGSKKKVGAKYLDGKDPEFKDGTHPRITLAEWVTSPKNPYFARTTANRLWGHFFGHGLMDPVDDEPSKDNPPSHPELLKVLAEQVVAHNFDMKYMIRAITLSKAYQRSSKQTEDSQKDPKLFAKMAVKGMTPELLFDSLVNATGYQDAQSQNPIYFNNNSARSKFISDFGSTDLPTETQTSILQALKLMNGKFIADATSMESSAMLGAIAESPFLSTEEKINVLFLATLTRYPSESEMNQMTNYINSGGPRNDTTSALSDVFWALLNCSEFRLNH